MGFFSNIGNKIKDNLAKKVGNKTTPTLSICMMGPRSVGKTTIMTSIFHESQTQICEGSSIYLKSLNQQTNQLNDYYLSLVDAVEKGNASNLPASNTVSEFLFGLGLKGHSEPSVKLEVRDFPGEYLTSQRSEDREDIYKFMSEATVILIAVDTPYLMEENGIYNEEKNKTRLVTHYLKDNADAIKDKLVLFVPLKCERYQHEGMIETVSEKTKEAYSELVDFFKNNNIASFVTPILTLGGIEFDRMEDNTMNTEVSKIAKYRLWEKRPEYKPLFCPQPLYYLLTYVTNYYELQQKQEKGFMASIISYIKDDNEFFEEMKSLTSYVMYDKNGFIPVTTNSILKIN